MIVLRQRTLLKSLQIRTSILCPSIPRESPSPAFLPTCQARLSFFGFGATLLCCQFRTIAGLLWAL